MLLSGEPMMRIQNHDRSTQTTRQNGYTLLELLLAVAIVGILSAIAIPNYKDYVTKGKIPDATANLATTRVKMEQYFQDNRTYVGFTGCPTASASQYFTFACAPGDATHYTITATGYGTMAGFQYTIDQDGAKKSEVSASGWEGSSNTCWITQKGGKC